MKFLTENLLPGDIVAVRSQTAFGKLIRACLGSYTNHNGMIILGKCNRLYVGEAVSPHSKLTTLAEYEEAMDEGVVVRIWRVPSATIEERIAASNYFLENLLGVKYPLSVARLWVYRFVNNLPWKIHGDWCTKLDFDAWGSVDPNIFNRPDGKKKQNPTPRTFENRLAAGVIHDKSESCIEE